jgi:hypothetical protein
MTPTPQVTTTPPCTTPQDDLARLLNVKEIYYEPAVLDYPRAQTILAHYPDAHLIEVASHWNIPDLHGNEGAVEDWNRIKRTVLVLGVKKSLLTMSRISLRCFVTFPMPRLRLLRSGVIGRYWSMIRRAKPGFGLA